MKQAAVVAAVVAAGLVSAQSPAYGQCGGIGWTGPTSCVSGYTCTYSNAYYSQCVPGGSGGTTAKTTTPAKTTAKTTMTTKTTTAATGVSTSADFCGQWDTKNTGTFILYNNLWGESAATSGSQCTGLDYASGNTIRWHTSWSWQGGPYNVKSFANSNLIFTPKKLSAVGTIPTTIAWTYTGTSGMVADVAFDIFTASTAGSSTSNYEIMVWFGAYGGAGPISSSGSTIATPSIGGISWKLYSGPNGSMTVFSFVASNAPVTSWSGDLNLFLKYLESNQGLSNSQYLNTVQFGTEPFLGTNAKFTVTNLSVAVN